MLFVVCEGVLAQNGDSQKRVSLSFSFLIAKLSPTHSRPLDVSLVSLILLIVFR